MTMLAEHVEVVIGVDTHRDTHTAAVVIAATGAAIEQATVCAAPDGYRELLALADQHSPSRAWSIEGTGSYGRGLTRFLAQRGELVVEIERPVRPARRSGAKSDPIDAVRAGREALSSGASRRTPSGGSAGRHCSADDRSAICGRCAHRHATPAPRAGDHRTGTAPGPVRGQDDEAHRRDRSPVACRWSVGSRDPSPRGRAARHRSPLPRAPSRSLNPRSRDPRSDRGVATRPARPARRRSHRRGDSVVRVVASRTLSQRRSVREPRRRRTTRSLVWAHHAAPTQPSG